MRLTGHFVAQLCESVLEVRNAPFDSARRRVQAGERRIELLLYKLLEREN